MIPVRATIENQIARLVYRMVDWVSYHWTSLVPSNSTTVRVTPETHNALKSMAEQRGMTMQDLIADLVQHARAALFLEEMNAGYAALKADDVAWAEELAERAEWDGVLADGLE